MRSVSKKILRLSLAILISFSAVTQAETTGPVIKGQKYDLGSSFIETEYVIPFQENGLWGFRDNNGKVKIKPKYQEIGTPQTYKMTSTWGSQTIERAVIPVSLNGKWGFVAQNGKEIIKPIYDKVLSFQTERIQSGFNEGNLRGVVIVQKGDRFIIVNDKGKQTDAPEMKSVVSAGPFTFSTDNGTLKMLSAPQAMNVKRKGDIYIVYERYESNLKGIIHPSSSRYFPAVTEFNDKFLVTDENGKSGMLSSSGNWLIPAEYEITPSKKLLLLKKDNLMGGADWQTGQMIIPMEFSTIGEATNTSFIVSKEGQYGVYDLETGGITVPMEYSLIKPAGDHGYIVGKGDRQGYMNKDLQTIIPIEHKEVGILISNTLYILDDDKNQQTLWSLTQNKPICHNYSGWYNYIEGHGLPIACGGKKGLLGVNGIMLLPPNYTDFKSRPNMDGRRGYLYTYNSNGIGLAYADGNEGYVIVEPGKFTSFNNEYETEFITGEIGKGNGAAISKNNNKIIGPCKDTKALVKYDKVYFVGKINAPTYCYNKKGTLIGSEIIRSEAQIEKFINRTLYK